MQLFGQCCEDRGFGSLHPALSARASYAVVRSPHVALLIDLALLQAH
jgi:hypothetical protein